MSEPMHRLTCKRCGFDGYFNIEFGHICQRMVSLDQWEVLEAKLARMEELLRAFSKGRCYACGWTLAAKAEDGCIPFNCSFRPDERDSQHQEWLKRANEMEAIRRELEP